MTLLEKKEHIIRCIKLGMELFRAMLVAGCTEKEIELIEKDIEFNELVKQYHALEEYNLLMKHKTAMDVAAVSGRTNAIQWKLERINPDRWSTAEDKGIIELPNLQVTLKGVEVKKDAS